MRNTTDFGSSTSSSSTIEGNLVVVSSSINSTVRARSGCDGNSAQEWLPIHISCATIGGFEHARAGAFGLRLLLDVCVGGYVVPCLYSTRRMSMFTDILPDKDGTRPKKTQSTDKAVMDSE